MDNLQPSPELTNAVQGVLTLPWTHAMSERLANQTFEPAFETYAMESGEAIETLREEVGRKVVLVIEQGVKQGRFSLEACLHGSVSIKMSDEPPADSESKIDNWRGSTADELTELLVDIAVAAYVDQHKEFVSKLLNEAKQRNDEYEAGEGWNDALEDHVTETNDSVIDDKQLVIDLLKDELSNQDFTTQLRAKLLPPSPEETLSDDSPQESA